MSHRYKDTYGLPESVIQDAAARIERLLGIKMFALRSPTIGGWFCSVDPAVILSPASSAAQESQSVSLFPNDAADLEGRLFPEWSSPLVLEVVAPPDRAIALEQVLTGEDCNAKLLKRQSS